MPVLSAAFSGLKMLTMVAISPLSFICGLALILLTYKIARQAREQASGRRFIGASRWRNA